MAAFLLNAWSMNSAEQSTVPEILVMT